MAVILQGLYNAKTGLQHAPNTKYNKTKIYKFSHTTGILQPFFCSKIFSILRVKYKFTSCSNPPIDYQVMPPVD